MHLKRHEKRAGGVVLVADRGAEEREQRVARELLDIAFVAVDDPAQRGDDRINHLDQLLGVQTVGERRETRHVGE